MVTRSPVPTRQARQRRYDGRLGTGRCLRGVRATLARWGVDLACEEAADAVLVAAELLANAHRHGGGIRSCELSLRGSRLRVAVRDGNREEPRPALPHQPSRPSGHGLYLVERLSVRWGVFPCGDGKTVWAELRVR